MENHDQHASEHCDEMLREQFNDRREYLPPAAVVGGNSEVPQGNNPELTEGD
jgi:hypothetical protein